MKCRSVCMLLMLCLLLGMATPALASSFGRSRYDFESLEFTGDAVFSKSFVAYNNFVLRSGAHLTFGRYSAAEIYGDLILEEGASLTAVDDTAFFSIGHEGSVQGLDLYYRCRYFDGSEALHKLPPLQDVYEKTDVWSQMNPEFRYDAACGLWVLKDPLSVGSIPEPDESLYNDHDITLSGTKTFTSGLDNYYRNFTVAPGADITLNIDTRDIRITGKLTIPADAALKGFTTLALTPDAEYDAPLYLMVDDQPEPLTCSISELCQLAHCDEVVSFRYDAALNGWVTKDSLHAADLGRGGGNEDGNQADHGGEAMAYALDCANQLNRLGLFQGTGTLPDGSPDYALDRPGKRQEAIVMLIRLLGKEEETRSGEWHHPFVDVPAWADPYVGYAYENGLTNGMDATHFGSDNDVNAQQYLTFLLRALGYTDGDTWARAFDLAQSCGIYDDSELHFMPPRLSFEPFWRADMAILSRSALNSNGSRDRQLAGLLMEEGVFTQEQWDAVR